MWLLFPLQKEYNTAKGVHEKQQLHINEETKKTNKQFRIAHSATEMPFVRWLKKYYYSHPALKCFEPTRLKRLKNPENIASLTFTCSYIAELKVHLYDMRTTKGVCRKAVVYAMRLSIHFGGSFFRSLIYASSFICRVEYSRGKVMK